MADPVFNLDPEINAAWQSSVVNSVWAKYQANTDFVLADQVAKAPGVTTNQQAASWFTPHIAALTDSIGVAAQKRGALTNELPVSQMAATSTTGLGRSRGPGFSGPPGVR